MSTHFAETTDRCFYELNDIRNFAIDLTAKRNSVESKKHRDIELLGDEDKARIDELFIYPKNNAELKNTLIEAIDIIYENISIIFTIIFYIRKIFIPSHRQKNN